jgi:hypothetical protein
LKSLFKKKKKTSDQEEVWMMYAGTMSCPVLTPPEPLTPPEHEDSLEDEEKDEMPKVLQLRVPSAPPTKPLPILPLDTFLPKHDISNYESALEKAVNELQNDFQSGARQLADASLSHLAHITEIGVLGHHGACSKAAWASTTEYERSHYIMSTPHSGADR